jgi:hypothetical protein
MHEMNLQVLGWEETRGVVPKKSSDGSRVEDLIATVNTTVLVHARLQDGPPFTVTFDGEVFWSAIAPFIQDFSPSFDHVYLLGWYDETGKPFLSSWDGSRPVRNFVITGAKPTEVPLWNAAVPPNAKLYFVPMGKDPKEYAKELGGYHAIGWWMPKIDRKSKGR